MRTVRTTPLLVALLLAAPTAGADPLAPWRAGVKVSAVSDGDQHSIHTYFNTSPESPDGRHVLFYASTADDAQEGEVRVRERASGKETVLARGVVTEDAHRAACQQWVSGGRRVAYHNALPGGGWAVLTVDLATGKERLLAKGRQLGFGQPARDLVPLYGPHWAPGPHRGLELADVGTGEIRTTPVTPDAVRKAAPDVVKAEYGDAPVSIFFPLLSPDLSRVLFKLATPRGGDFRSKAASHREGLFCYDLKADRFLFAQEKWGHPAWHPDSRHVLNTRGRVTDAETAKVETLPGAWKFPGSHPSYSPDGRLFTTDTQAHTDPFGGPQGSWAVVVGDARTGEFVTVHRFDNSKGAKSWRVSHPHPAFSPDGQRVYFNVSDGRRTRLHVAEVSR
jgi:hypothetical protein